MYKKKNLTYFYLIKLKIKKEGGLLALLGKEEQIFKMTINKKFFYKLVLLN